MADVITCQNCGEDLRVSLQAQLPAMTELTLSIGVQPGQFVRLDTIAGTLSAWRDLQIAVGESLGAQTEVFLAGMEKVDDELRFTTLITNTPAVVEGAAS